MRNRQLRATSGCETRSKTVAFPMSPLCPRTSTWN